MADPGFPVECQPRRGGIDSRGSYVSKILYFETKESGTLRGAYAGDTLKGAITLEPPVIFGITQR